MRFRTFYTAGLTIFPFLVILPTASFAFLAWRVAAGRMAYGFAAASTFVAAPFTLLVQGMTTKAIISKADVVESKTRGGSEAEGLEALLDRWALLNGIKGLLPLLGAVVGLSTILMC
ncbi:hypothetical protein POJ06DRAFT_262681 [Lipomyces tetrasporus]|uniref:DUF1772-domain-containing protein n=1 Tax=Lipomyces tetrasporus TaxID=54092 RepID=A0AAD7VPH6_9ASCO|nr:uncharacterized protein POJ06DRAFT_262681 [Lipomyces tetrasporus]KAJ8097163.1 hypothetical protein POJ06DRAFT_262681 [Lipomyces tetrasporus]